MSMASAKMVHTQRTNKQSSMKAYKNRRLGLSLFFTALTMLLFLFPFYIMIVSSFKTAPEIAASILALPTHLSLDNFIEGMQKSNFFQACFNSVLCTFPSVALIVLMSSMAGFTLARNGDRKAIHIAELLFLASLMIPFQILMIPIYRIYKTLGLQNNFLGMIIMLTGNSIAYASFLYTGFVKSIPRDLEEAAMIDGCGPYRAFFSVVFPLLKPITSTVAALHIMWLWNDFNIGLILLQKEEVRTLPIKQFYFFGEHSTDYGVALAAALLCALPVLIFFSAMQKYIVDGIAMGAVKG